MPRISNKYSPTFTRLTTLVAVVDILKKGTGVAICYENGVLQEYGYEDLPSVTPKVPSSIEPVHGVEEGDDFFKNVIREATSSMELESEVRRR